MRAKVSRIRRPPERLAALVPERRLRPRAPQPSAEIGIKRRIFKANEYEKRAFGRELHDGPGQTLAGIAFLAKVLERKLGEASSPLQGDANWVVDLLNRAIAEIKALANGLYPVAIDRGGLAAALAALAAQVEEVYGVAVGFDRCAALEPDLASATHLYRIAQEAVNNALRHGRARRIRLRLSQRRAAISLVIADDGGGFAVASVAGGVGLRSMRDRADIAGGRFRLRSLPGRGTSVTVRITGGNDHA